MSNQKEKNGRGDKKKSYVPLEDFDYFKFCNVSKCEVYHADGFNLKLMFNDVQLCLKSCLHSFELLHMSAVIQYLNNATCSLMLLTYS